MNLIKIVNSECYQYWKDSLLDIDGLATIKPTEKRINDIKLALLEYRRKHRIFEVGDAIVIPSRGNGIFHFNALFSDSDIAEARHATPAEIQAGKRLD